MGVVNRALPAGEVLPAVRALAARLARRAPIPLAQAKRLIGPAGTLTREQALERERAALEEIFRTADWAEGVAAFREGRAPDYRGR